MHYAVSFPLVKQPLLAVGGTVAQSCLKGQLFTPRSIPLVFPAKYQALFYHLCSVYTPPRQCVSLYRCLQISSLLSSKPSTLWARKNEGETEKCHGGINGGILQAAHPPCAARTFPYSNAVELLPRLLVFTNLTLNHLGSKEHILRFS